MAGKDSNKAIGGHARAEALTPEERKEIARKAALARWDVNIPRAEFAGELKIGDTVIECANLKDGTRVLSRISFIRAIGRKGKAKGGRAYDEESKTPVFLTAKNLKPFISEELLENSTPMPFIFNGVKSIGYKAELLPQVCSVFIDAHDAGKLNKNQGHIAAKCKILLKGFATVGIIALVDEATGYQDIRSREALQLILDKFLRKEFATWAKTFPDDFYKEIFRLRNWNWRGMKVNRPQVVAKYTNNIVYQRLAPGILDELETRNPKDDKGKRKTKHHQWLTENVGHPALAQHLYAVIGLMRISDNWDEFIIMINKAYPRRMDARQMLLF